MGSESRSCGTLWTMPATQKCARSTLFFPRNVVSRSFKQHQQCSGSRYQGVSRGAGAFFAERGTPLRARDASRFFVDFSRPAPEAGTVRDHRRKRPDSKKFPPAGPSCQGGVPPRTPPLEKKPKFSSPPRRARNRFREPALFFFGPSTALKFLTYYSTFLQHFYRLPP